MNVEGKLKALLHLIALRLRELNIKVSRVAWCTPTGMVEISFTRDHIGNVEIEHFKCHGKCDAAAEGLLDRLDSLTRERAQALRGDYHAALRFKKKYFDFVARIIFCEDIISFIEEPSPELATINIEKIEEVGDNEDG